jgi:hypothetical protein
MVPSPARGACATHSGHAARKRPRRRVVALLVATLLPAPARALAPAEVSAGQRALDALPAEERSRLLAHRVLVLEPGRRGMTVGALMIVDRPPRETFERLARPAEQRCYLPEVKKSTSVRRTPRDELVEFEVDKVFTVRYRVLHHFWPERLAIDWALDPTFDNGVRDLRGYFQVLPISPGKSLVEYGTAVDASRVLPAFLQRRFMRRDVPAALHRLAEYLGRRAGCP